MLPIILSAISVHTGPAVVRYLGIHTQKTDLFPPYPRLRYQLYGELHQAALRRSSSSLSSQELRNLKEKLSGKLTQFYSLPAYFCSFRVKTYSSYGCSRPPHCFNPWPFLCAANEPFSDTDSAVQNPSFVIFCGLSSS